MWVIMTNGPKNKLHMFCRTGTPIAGDRYSQIRLWCSLAQFPLILSGWRSKPDLTHFGAVGTEAKSLPLSTSFSVDIPCALYECTYFILFVAQEVTMKTNKQTCWLASEHFCSSSSSRKYMLYLPLIMMPLGEVTTVMHYIYAHDFKTGKAGYLFFAPQNVPSKNCTDRAFLKVYGARNTLKREIRHF